MPSSKCTQISLAMGEVLNDLKIVLGESSFTQGQRKLILKCLSDKAKELDLMVMETEKNCYDAGWNAAKTVEVKENPEGLKGLEDMEK